MLSRDNGNTKTNHYDDIANTFNNYFASIPETTKNNLNIHINIFQTIFRKNVSYNISETWFTSTEEIGNITSSLNSNKASGRNSIP